MVDNIGTVNKIVHVNHCDNQFPSKITAFAGANYRILSVELFKYLQATNSSRNFIEGEEVANSGFIVLCGVTEADVHKCKIVALCLQSSALSENPHEIQGVLSFQAEIINIISFTCSCKAGKSGKCKHIAAVLILCSRYKIGELEVISQTDLKCMWKNKKDGALSQFKHPVPWMETDCFKFKYVPSPILPEDKKTYNLEKLLNINIESAVSKHRLCRRQLKAAELEAAETFQPNITSNALKNLEVLVLEPIKLCCFQTYKDMFANIDVQNINILTKINAAAWLKERQFRITGSRCYEVYTYSKQDWHKKSKQYFWPKMYSNQNMEYGKKTEKEARELYKSMLGYKVIESGLLVSEYNPWLAYSPDGIIIDNFGHPIKLLEIKCPVRGQEFSPLEIVQDCKYIKIINNALSLNPKHQYYGQVQLGMAMLNVLSTDFIIYSKKTESFLNIIVDYDEQFVISMLSDLKEKYFNRMLHAICLKNNL